MLTQKPRVPIRQILIYGFLPSFLKILVYRLKGYRIGKRVFIGMGSIIRGKKVFIGDGVSIGFFTIIRGDKIHLGNHVIVGSTTFLDTPNIVIGEGTRINEQVFVGGLQFPNSTFTVGRNCLIQQMSFINPSPSITIGDETAIGGHCLIFGHVSWQNYFEGYPVEFSPIEIGNHVGIGWRAFILPGAKIGDGAMIGANSVVNRSIPPRCLAVGFPARIVSKEPEFPRKVSDAEKAKMLKQIVDEMVEYLSAANIEIRATETDNYQVNFSRKKFFRNITESRNISVFYQRIGDDQTLGFQPSDTVISLIAIPIEVRTQLDKRDIFWIDIQGKERSDLETLIGDEVVLFLKRYGVRLYRKKMAD